MKYWVGVLAILLVACGGATGNVIQEEFDAQKAELEQKIANLQVSLSDKESLVAAKEALVADAQVVIANLEQELEGKQELINQQKVVLKQIDSERVEAVAEAEKCEDLEEKNKKLQDMLDICQEDLS